MDCGIGGWNNLACERVMTATQGVDEDDGGERGIGWAWKPVLEENGSDEGSSSEEKGPSVGGRRIT